jgi:hypothetical protein
MSIIAVLAKRLATMTVIEEGARIGLVLVSTRQALFQLPERLLLVVVGWQRL